MMQFTDYQSIMLVYLGINSLITLGTSCWMFFLNKTKANSKKIDHIHTQLDKRIGHCEQRLEHVPSNLNRIIGNIETNLKSIPNKETFNQMHRDMGEIKGSLDQLTRQINVIHQALLSDKP